jgi:hypothetical protein
MMLSEAEFSCRTGIRHDRLESLLGATTIDHVDDRDRIIVLAKKLGTIAYVH